MTKFTSAKFQNILQEIALYIRIMFAIESSLEGLMAKLDGCMAPLTATMDMFR